MTTNAERPADLRDTEAARTVEKIILDALPGIASKLVSMAKEGHIAAARYLIDRVLGRPARTTAASPMQNSLPFREGAGVGSTQPSHPNPWADIFSDGAATSSDAFDLGHAIKSAIPGVGPLKRIPLLGAA